MSWRVREDPEGSGRVQKRPGGSGRVWEGRVESQRVQEGPGGSGGLEGSWRVQNGLEGSRRVWEDQGGSIGLRLHSSCPFPHLSTPEEVDYWGEQILQLSTFLQTLVHILQEIIFHLSTCSNSKFFFFFKQMSAPLFLFPHMLSPQRLF